MRRNFVGRPARISSLLSYLLLLVLLLFGQAYSAVAQQDQGAITGNVTDPTGASIPNASVTLTNVETGLVLNVTSDNSGNYTFSPIKIGNYKVTATAPGFSTTTQNNIRVDVQSRAEVNLKLSTGVATTTVEVTEAPPLLQTQEASTGQVIQAKTINDTPLNGRNWVFIAQLTAGVAPASGARGQGKGDFNANGQRAEQNNFILDGVDNNTNVVDFLNGASFVVRPPPDALAEFKVQTGAYSAEFGHSAGAVVNASIKSGTNAIHGDLWEYIRNDAFDVKEYFNSKVSKYRQNQFGATLGFPIIKDKLFLFGDAEANRIVFANPKTGISVPTALMRQGNFSELLNPALTNGGNPITLYQPGSGGATPLSCNGQANVFCPGQIDAVAQGILNLYPLPNANGGKVFNNYNTTVNDTDNTFQWDARMDWNVSSKDQMFARHSYLNEPGNRPPPLGNILDGGGFGDTGQIKTFGQNFAFSETHLFNPTLSNEFRFGYNWGHFAFTQPNANNNIAPTLGLGGIPFFKLNGGLPNVSVNGIDHFGSPTFYVSNEFENVFQILDNVTKQAGNHSLHGGVNFQHVRFSTTQPTQPRGSYNFDGTFTSKPGTSNTGYGVADFLANSMKSGAISNFFNTDDVRWYRAGYFQDDWKISQALTVNYGLRYDYFQPTQERHGNQAAFSPTGQLSPGKGQAVYIIPSKNRNVPLAPAFTNLLQKNNIALQYSSNPGLVEAQKGNVAPRFGFAYTASDKFVVRGGYGLFYGGLESTGYYPNLGENYPFEFDSNFNVPSGCSVGSCPTNGLTLENGFSQSIAEGLQNFISTPGLRGSELKIKTPYSQSYNLSVEYAVSSNMVATVSYAGSISRHLAVFPDPNSPAGLVSVNDNSNAVRPFPGFGGTAYTAYDGSSNYNSMQAKLERRYSSGISYLATYTYSHSLDDAPTPLGSTADSGYRGTNIVPIGLDYANSPFDVRHRFTFNGNYELPFGHGRKYMTSPSRLADYAVGGWSTSLVFRAQTGEPITVGTANFTGANGAGNRAIRIRNPYSAGGTSTTGITCPTKVRTTDHWYNPCAFTNPVPGDLLHIPVGTVVTGQAALPYLGSARNNWYGPGYERVDMSLFKNFTTFREQSLQFRADAFNLLNTPAYGDPSTADDGQSGGRITGPRTFQSFTPDSRFFQFALKYIF